MWDSFGLKASFQRRERMNQFRVVRKRKRVDAFDHLSGVLGGDRISGRRLQCLVLMVPLETVLSIRGCQDLFWIGGPGSVRGRLTLIEAVQLCLQVLRTPTETSTDGAGNLPCLALVGHAMSSRSEASAGGSNSCRPG